MPLPVLATVQSSQQRALPAAIGAGPADQLRQLPPAQAPRAADESQGLLPLLNNFLTSRDPHLSLTITNPLREPFGVRISSTNENGAVASYTYVPIGDPGGGVRLVDVPVLAPRPGRALAAPGGGAFDGDVPLDDC